MVAVGYPSDGDTVWVSLAYQILSLRWGHGLGLIRMSATVPQMGTRSGSHSHVSYCPSDGDTVWVSLACQLLSLRWGHGLGLTRMSATVNWSVTELRPAVWGTKRWWLHCQCHSAASKRNKGLAPHIPAIHQVTRSP